MGAYIDKAPHGKSVWLCQTSISFARSFTVCCNSIFNWKAFGWCLEALSVIVVIWFAYMMQKLTLSIINQNFYRM